MDNIFLKSARSGLDNRGRYDTDLKTAGQGIGSRNDEGGYICPH